jgi:protein involved in polysaccharide export with SLBB domain
MPAKAGIQQGVDSLDSRSLDPGFRRGDESNFNRLLERKFQKTSKIAVRFCWRHYWASGVCINAIRCLPKPAHTGRKSTEVSMGQRLFFLFVAGLLTALAGMAHAQDRGDPLSRYRLGSGDVISISVVGEEDLKREKVRLSDAGTIQFPVLGELRIKGLTIGELEQQVTSGLKGRYLVNPKVVVNIDEYRPFFINGEVYKPGGYAYVPGLTVLKAVTIGGGFKDRASKSKMFVVRDGDSNRSRQKVEMDTAIYPGDILTIEESFF